MQDGKDNSKPQLFSIDRFLRSTRIQNSFSLSVAIHGDGDAVWANGSGNDLPNNRVIEFVFPLLFVYLVLQRPSGTSLLCICICI